MTAVPVDALAEDTLQALLEEFASRDGTDYGERETPLADRVEQLRAGLVTGRATLLYDADSEQWDILAAEDAATWLGAGDGADEHD